MRKFLSEVKHAAADFLPDGMRENFLIQQKEKNRKGVE